MIVIAKKRADIVYLQKLLAKGVPAPGPQPATYDGFVVLKPWGYEFQVFDNGKCSIWLACLRPGAQVSMHCHQRKQAQFLPLSPGLVLTTLHETISMVQAVGVDPGVFHSQENRSETDDAYFLEYEWPSDKTDLVRLSDRYGRAGKGYEGQNNMVPLTAEYIPAGFRFVKCLKEVA